MLLIKIAIFVLFVIIIPWLACVVVKHATGNDEAGFNVGGFLLLAFFFLWFIGSGVVAANTQTKWVKEWDTQLSSLATNTYIKSTTSKLSVSNSTVARYDYYINNNGTFNSYWVNTDVASVKLENGALRMEAWKKVMIPNFFTKYVTAAWVAEPNDNSYIFYVDPKYASENLGINIGK